MLPAAILTKMQRDTTLTKLFVGGLPYHTTGDTLRKYFEQYGEIEEAVVITDRQTGKSKGYGFVTMVEHISAEEACKVPNPIIDGRKANVNLAYLGAKPRIQTTDIQSSLPFSLKSVLAKSNYPGQIASLTQFITPSAYVTTPTGGVNIPSAPAAVSPSSQTAAVPVNVPSPFIDYSTIPVSTTQPVLYPQYIQGYDSMRYPVSALFGYVVPTATYPSGFNTTVSPVPVRHVVSGTTCYNQPQSLVLVDQF